MEVLRSYSQLVNKTESVLKYDISETPILDDMPEENLEYIANHSVLCEDKKKIGELAELVFQLNNYVPALVNYTKIFLYMSEFAAVEEFISKLFVGHVGNMNYVSKFKDYNIQERLFDRFIEVVKYANISVELYMPLVLDSIFNEDSSLYVWHDIALEYMQNFMRENEEQLEDYISQNSKYELEYLSLILNFDTLKGIDILFNVKSFEEVSEQNAELFLKTYITDTLAYFDKYLPHDAEKRLHYIKVLSAITNNVEVETRLANLYEEEKDTKIKEYLAQRLGITQNLTFGTEQHFKVLAQKKVEMVQERSLGVAFENMPLLFKSGESANDLEKTFLIDIFRNEKNLLNLLSLKSLYEVFDAASLNGFAQKLFDKHSQSKDILSAKWCVRMFALFSDGLFERAIFELLFALYKLGRNKEANYLAECLIYSKKPNFIEMFSRLQNFDAFAQRREQYMQLFASINNKNVEEVKDLTVGENLTDAEIEQERKRLYVNFISGRRYSRDMFKRLFLHNKVFNGFANRLVFGEYKQGKLYSIFIVRDKEIIYIYGGMQQTSENDVYISIVHQLDLDERFEKADLNLPNPLFKQFGPNVIDINNFNRANMSVGNFMGTIVNGEDFVKTLKKKGFVPNINVGEVQFSSLVYANSVLNILVEIEFQKPITVISAMATLGHIRFYRLSEVMRDGDKYITNKSQSLSLGGVNERFFDFVLSSIKTR